MATLYTRGPERNLVRLRVKVVVCSKILDRALGQQVPSSFSSCPSTIKIRVWNQRLRAPLNSVQERISHLRSRSWEHKLRGAMLRVLVFLVSLGTRALQGVCRRRANLVMENLALRQQVTALKKERPHTALDDVDRAFWVALRASWPSWASRLVIVNADTVARWHRDRFRRYWAKDRKNQGLSAFLACRGRAKFEFEGFVRALVKAEPRPTRS